MRRKFRQNWKLTLMSYFLYFEIHQCHELFRGDFLYNNIVSACNRSSLLVFQHLIVSENIRSIHPKQWQVIEYKNGQKTLKNLSSKILTKFKLFHICLTACGGVGKSHLICQLVKYLGIRVVIQRNRELFLWHQ